MSSVFAPRDERLAALSRDVFDIAVIGGGITGAAVARDAAARGLSVALVEREDWAAGTSWRSTKLVHGGLRYLETGEVHLVFESLAERDLLLAAAPHLVRPAEFLLPSFRHRGRPAWQVALGLTAYDLLALGHAPSRHRRLSREQVVARERLLEGPELVSGAVYPDGRTDDARLTLENVLDAVSLGAVTATGLEVVGLTPGKGSAARVELRDRESGRTLSALARCVVNAAGPWADRVRQLEDAASAGMLRLSRGVHLVVPFARLPLSGIVAFPMPDGRLLFAIPDGAVTLLGTTDTDFSGTPDAVFAERTDVDYLLAAARRTFPAAALTESDVAATFAGLRPLVYRPGKSVGKTSREEAIVVSDGGLVTVTGGKLTTHRRMAEHAVNRIAAQWKREGRAATRPCATRGRPFPGAAGAFLPDVERAAVTFSNPGLSEETARHLVGRYGVRSAAVVGLTVEDRALGRPIVEGLPDIDAEVVFAVRWEDARSLSDVFIRRTHLFWQAPRQGMEAAERAAALLARELHWRKEEERASLDAYAREVSLSRACLKPY